MTRLGCAGAHGEENLDVLGLSGPHEPVLGQQRKIAGYDQGRRPRKGRVRLPVAAPSAQRARTVLLEGQRLGPVEGRRLGGRYEVPVRRSDGEWPVVPGDRGEFKGQRKRTGIGAQGDVAYGIAGPGLGQNEASDLRRRHRQGPRTRRPRGRRAYQGERGDTR